MIEGGDVTAVRGRGNWLFLNSVGPTAVLAGFADLTAWRRRRLPGLVASFRARSRRMAARNLPFLVVIAPEATGIHPDRLPEGTAVEVPTMAEHLAEALAREGVRAVCASSVLRGARGPVDTYQRVDSHWSSYGAFLCYGAVMAALGRRPAVGWSDVRYTVRTGFGDLSARVDPERPGAIHAATVPGLEAAAGPNVFDQRARNLRRHTCATGVGRALVFRDSFANGLLPFLERTFAETVLVGGSPAMPDDAVDLFAPDLVILEVAERSLLLDQDPFADWQPRTFDQLVHERATNPAGGALQVASRAAAEAGRRTEAIAAAAVAVALEGGEARLHNLGYALMEAGQADPALLKLGYALCRTAAPRGKDRCLHWLHGQLAYMTGREEEARAAMGRALALQPGNAQFLYSLAAWDYLRGDHAAALATMLRSIDGAPLHRDSWRVALACARALGSADARTLERDMEALFPDP